MLYSLFTHMHMATPEEVARLLPLVSEQRREAALRYSHVFGQFCCLKSYCMLMELIASVSPTLDGQTPEFAYNEHGKPYLADRPDIHFSISHTKNAILVAISNAPIGVDVEHVRLPSDGLIEKTMNPDEQALINNASSSCLEVDCLQGERAATFTSLWTKKEAVLKLLGTGILDDLHEVLSPVSVASIEISTEKSVSPAFCYSFAQFR